MPIHRQHLPQHQHLWSSPDSFTTTLLTLCLDTYGIEATTWLPETLLLEIEEDFDVSLSQANFDRLMTGIRLLTTDEFYKSLPDFIEICNVLSGDTLDPTLWDPADAGECAWGITEALLLSPPDEDEPFTDEIRRYLGQVLDAEGIITPPDVLRLAIRTNNPAANIPTEYTDDPDMYAAIYGAEESRSTDLKALLLDGLRRLSAQLESLPLREGNTKNVVQRLLKATARDTADNQTTASNLA